MSGTANPVAQPTRPGRKNRISTAIRSRRGRVDRQPDAPRAETPGAYAQETSIRRVTSARLRRSNDACVKLRDETRAHVHTHAARAHTPVFGRCARPRTRPHERSFFERRLRLRSARGAPRTSSRANVRQLAQQWVLEAQTNSVARLRGRPLQRGDCNSVCATHLHFEVGKVAERRADRLRETLRSCTLCPRAAIVRRERRVRATND